MKLTSRVLVERVWSNRFHRVGRQAKGASFVIVGFRCNLLLIRGSTVSASPVERTGRGAWELICQDAGPVSSIDSAPSSTGKTAKMEGPTRRSASGGKSYRLDTHRSAGSFQTLHAAVECPETVGEQDKRFAFTNRYPSTIFWMRRPILKKVSRNQRSVQVPPDDGFFPIGVYGGSPDNLGQIKDSGLNSAVVGLDEKNLAACSTADIHCAFSVAKDPERLISVLDRLEPLLEKAHFSFYVNDEPGIHSFPVWKAEDIQRILKSRYPGRATHMAIVRPRVIPDYQGSADYFMLDQYPVPNMPVTWLSDSMDEAAGFVGRDRLQSVIQAFGGGRFAHSGWPRLPTFAEMNNLAFLSVIHGSRGLYFFTWPEIISTQKSKEDFESVIRRLNSLRSWLQQKNDAEPPTVEMVSRYRFDPKGKPAVHCASKTLYGTKMLLCANTIDTYTDAEIVIPGGIPCRVAGVLQR